MDKILFINASPNKNGNTFRIGEELLANTPHDILQMSDYKIYQYNQVYSDDEISKVFEIIANYDTLVIGSPVYWYTVSGILKTFIDRLYMLDEARILQGKKLYLFAQGSAPDADTVKSITFLASRVATLMHMDLQGVVVDNSSGRKIISEMHVKWKHGNSKITIDEEGIESTSEKVMSNKLYWDAIEYIIINKYSISILPKNFASVALFIEINSKDELIKAFKKYKKKNY